MKETESIAIDVARNVFQVCRLGHRINVISNEPVRRRRLKQILAQQPPGTVAMEAC